MSYEGYEEFICENGHHWTVDASELLHGTNKQRKSAFVCPHCKKKAQYHCRVDETNGIDHEDVTTLPGPKNEVGFDDLQCKDHYGNKYFVKRKQFAPDLASGRWTTL